MSPETAVGNGWLVCAAMTTLDLVQLADRLPPPGTKASAGNTYFDVGGPAANAAITASTLGGAVTLMTVLGTGPLPDYARYLLASHWVNLREQRADGTLPIASIWVDGDSGERTILAADNSGVAVTVESGPLLPDGTTAVLLDGHYADLGRALAAAARAQDIPIVLDCGRWRPIYGELLPVASDVIMCASFRPPEWAAATDEEVVGLVNERWEPELCVMTRGSNEILVAQGGGIERIPVPEVEVVDTLGAGDVFHGAYLYSRYWEQRNARDSLRFAAELASHSCTHLGVRRRG